MGEQRNPPRSTDHTRWRPDTTSHPPAPCTVDGCTRDAAALGYCPTDAAVALVNAGVIRRRAHTLLGVLASDADLTVHGHAWLNRLRTATQALQDALDGTPIQEPPHNSGITHDRW
jgi:hypothetical protein